MDNVVSIIIRTYNEEKYLNELLTSIGKQKKDNLSIEVVIVDSGSTDRTLLIAKKYGCQIEHIKKESFTFGRSLNIGCELAQGHYLAFISGHCIPANDTWIQSLVSPLIEKKIAFTYGKQRGRNTTKFSEQQLFKKYFPNTSKIPQVGFFCNNANSAIRKDIWRRYKFDEKLTGLEDISLAQQLVKNNEEIGYISEALVYHIHNESWAQIKNRYEREAIALRKIMPELHFGFLDFIKCYFIGVVKDIKAAIFQQIFLKEFTSILSFRLAQYYGAYTGHHIHRKISHQMKIKYFYPRATNMDVTNDE